MMNKYIPTFTDISNWQINIYQNTGGSRSKKIALHPHTEKEYFFKGSKELENGEIRYPTEFWSEIVSSKVGQYLGFNMLDYNIGYNENDKQEIGCLSESMVKYEENKLTEGKTYLTGFDSTYDPDNDKDRYTFQFIKSALKYFELESFLPNLVEVIVFDALISNSDRHQENWGFITNFKETIDELEDLLKGKKVSLMSKIVQKFSAFKASGKSESSLHIQSSLAKNNFSPIYDSGCCLGREKDDDVVEKLLKDDNMLEAYINRGKSEIHWEGSKKKKGHFELVKLLKAEYPGKVNEVITRVKDKFELKEMTNIIENIDNFLPSNLFQYKLTDARKELMIKLITLRLQKLSDIQ